MVRLAIVLAGLAATPAPADTLVAARTVRALSIISPGDLAVVDAEVPGALTDPAEALGLEARAVLYEGRPIRPADVGPAATVERNGLVALVFQLDGLTITAEGRALGRGGPGDILRVMNLASRATVSGVVAADGRVFVGALP